MRYVFSAIALSFQLSATIYAHHSFSAEFDNTKPVTVKWELTGHETDPFGNLRAGFEGKATINRKDWGVNWNAALEAGGVLVSEKVTLQFDISAVKVQQAV